jgi:SAM-dependent methyltransferase
MGIRVSDPETWKQLWTDALTASAGRKADSAESISRWNSRAKHFGENSKQRSSQDKKDEVLDWLIGHGALKEGFKVLDVGAGAGRYAIPMAQMGCRVTALEPAEAMIEEMRQRAEEEKVTGISIINKPWQGIDLIGEGLYKEFDLVFASMTPGIQGPDDILRMIDASKHACYVSGHTRGRWYHMERVLKEVFGREKPESPGDFIYRFGLVYSLGYTPMTCVFGGKAMKGEAQTPAKLKENILWMLGNSLEAGEFTEDRLSKIDEYVASIDIETDKTASRGMASQAMLWFVD